MLHPNLNQNTDNLAHWFVGRVRNCQEFAIKKALEEIGIECYVPIRRVVRELKYRRKVIEIPVIKNLIFLYTSKEQACSATNDRGIQLFYIKDLNTRSMLVIPDKQMQDFMLVMSLSPGDVTIDECPMKIGMKIKVIEGNFCGIEGELISIGNRSHVMIRISQILAATVRIPKAFLKKLE